MGEEKRKYERHNMECTGLAIIPGESMQKIVIRDISMNGIAFSFRHLVNCYINDPIKIFFYDRKTSQLCSLDCTIRRVFDEGSFLAIGADFRWWRSLRSTRRKVTDTLLQVNALTVLSTEDR